MNQHLRYEERNAIECALNQNQSIQAIATQLKRDRKTIVDEIRRNGQWVEKGAYGRGITHCEYRWKKLCKETNLCPEAQCTQPNRRNNCHSCNRCEFVCTKFKKAQWERLLHSPYCCNACPQRATCPLFKFLYFAGQANTSAQERKSQARAGCSYSYSELQHMSTLLQEGSKKGQSFHHIYTSNRDDFFCSERNLYLLKEKGLLDVKNIDMPATVQRKIRNKRNQEEHKVDKTCRCNRTYQDYLIYLEEHPGVMTVQMDVVEGCKEDLKCFLGLAWPHLQLALYFLMERQTARCVQTTLTYLANRLGNELFEMLFPVILTDNGSEFSNPSALEQLGTRIFYCDPGASHQKGHVENQNGRLRKVVPKGWSIQKLQFEDSFRINAHLNSYVRLSVNNNTPFQMLKQLYPPAVIDAFHLYEVHPNEVVLKPLLLKGKLERK